MVEITCRVMTRQCSLVNVWWSNSVKIVIKSLDFSHKNLYCIEMFWVVHRGECQIICDWSYIFINYIYLKSSSFYVYMSCLYLTEWNKNTLNPRIFGYTSAFIFVIFNKKSRICCISQFLEIARHFCISLRKIQKNTFLHLLKKNTVD